MPSLIVPFAIVGLAAGWLSGRAANGPLFNAVVVNDVPELAAACCAVTCAIAGALLWLRCRRGLSPLASLAPKRAWHSVPMPVVILLTGAISAMIIGSQLSYVYAFESAGTGALFSLLFMPVCAVVMAAAKRAARGRYGSIIASSDRRGVWSVLAVTLGVTTLMSLPEWTSELFLKYSGPPWVAIGIAVAAFGVVLLSFCFDVLAWWRIRRLLGLSDRMERRRPDESRGQDTVPSVDIGLGEELRAEIAVGSTYRSQGSSVTALLRGNLAEARRIVRATLVRSGASAVVSAAVIVVHGFASKLA